MKCSNNKYKYLENKKGILKKERERFCGSRGIGQESSGEIPMMLRKTFQHNCWGRY